mmetsp:Transcript_19003/g.45523  ORF Transcript_19003/g.45523 Transcript_19003/m.45523 type:complete len:86 (+) Transcript_19003:619-876(+)
MHGDDESGLSGGTVFGLNATEFPCCVRTLRFQSNDGKLQLDLPMHGGAAYVMRGDKFQRRWKHGIPPSKTVKGTRYSLTARVHSS